VSEQEEDYEFTLNEKMHLSLNQFKKLMGRLFLILFGTLVLSGLIIWNTNDVLSFLNSLRRAASHRSIGDAGWPTRPDNSEPQPCASEARLPLSSDRTGDIMILGPIPSPVAKIRGRHRWQLLVKSVDATAARGTVKTTLDELEAKNRKGGLKFEVDVDPVEMM